jgi:hypothetical protein
MFLLVFPTHQRFFEDAGGQHLGVQPPLDTIVLIVVY